MLQPSAHNESIGIESDGRKRFRRRQRQLRQRRGRLEPGLGSTSAPHRPASSLEISAGPNFDAHHSLAQYVDAFEDPVAAATYGSRYVFSTLDQKEFSLQTRVNYVLSPKMSLQVYMQPLVSVGHYTGSSSSPGRGRSTSSTLDGDPGSLTYDPATRNTPRPRPTAAPRSSSTIPTSTSSRCA